MVVGVGTGRNIFGDLPGWGSEINKSWSRCVCVSGAGGGAGEGGGQYILLGIWEGHAG